MAAKQNMMRAITQTAVEAAKAAIMAVKEAENPMKSCQISTSDAYNRWSSTESANIHLESGRQMPRTTKLGDRGKGHFHD